MGERNHRNWGGTKLAHYLQAIENIGGTICGTTGGTGGTIVAKVLKTLAEAGGTVAEPHTPLKGERRAPLARVPLQGERMEVEHAL